jgi:hypothetical protein
VDAIGRVNFRDDVYGRDRRLRIALATRDSELVLCRNPVRSGPLQAVDAAVATHPIASAGPSTCIGVPSSQPIGNSAGNLMSGT